MHRLRSLATLLIAVWFAAPRPVAAADPASPAAAAAGVKSKPDVVIYEGTYPGWPWVAAGADGTLYCVFRDGTQHGFSAEGRALITRSTDRGRTWSPASVIVDAAGIDDRNVAIVELPNRDLLVTYNTYARLSEKPLKTVSQAMSIRSRDGGRTWETPRKGPFPDTQTRAAAHVLADGTLVWPCYIATSQSPAAGAVAALSRDNGETWEGVRLPDSRTYTGDEWDLLEVQPGRIVGIMRNANFRFLGGWLCKTESRDGGRTWDLPEPTNLHTRIGHAPAQIVLQGGTPTVIYPERRFIAVAAARSSDPRLLDWEVDRQLSCYRYNANETRIPDGSYAVSAPTGPRERIVVDYEIRPESKRITGYFVTFPENW